MFASFKKLFRKDTEGALATSIPELGVASQTAEWTTSPSRVVSPSFPSETAASGGMVNESAESVPTVSLPLKVVFASLPNSLSSAVQSQGNGFVAISCERILQELPKGAVRLPFGEIRMASPLGTFLDNTRHDLTLVELPLGEILPRLNPAMLSRRPNQKKIQVPEEVGNIFGPRGQGISVSRGPAPKPVPAPIVAPSQPAATPAPVQAEPSAPIRMPSFEKPAPAPTVISAPQLRVLQSEPTKGECLNVALSALSTNWPPMVKAEIVNSSLATAVVALPLDKLEPALRSGKIIFTWKQICSWLEPKLENAHEASDEILDLPLNIVAPIFLAKHRPAKVQKKIAISEVPDIFVGKNIAPAPAPKDPIAAQPAAPVAPAAPTIKMQPPLAMAPAEPKPTIIPMEKAENTLGTLFGQPAKQNWSPMEIVKGLITQPGVLGAFIAMQDGLLVSAELPAPLKPETVAAFLPQIFGKMNQYAKELHLGTMSRMSFEVETVAWQVLKVGSIYLVVLTNPGEELSREKITCVASEIRKQIQ